MNILVTNDDGFNSEGIKILSESIKDKGNIYIVAPHNHMSGASISSNIFSGITVHKQAKNIWSIEGTPSDCVKYAIYGLKLDIDVVLSGINKGFNIGIDTIYSGTVGAAMEALRHGIKACAFSSEYNGFNVAKNEIGKTIDFIFENNLLSDNFILNVNFPKEIFKESKGIEITDLAIRRSTLHFEQKGDLFFPKRTFAPYEYQKGTDLWARKYGYTSITPLKLGNGDKSLIKELKHRI